MRAAPARTKRPVVVVGGLFDPLSLAVGDLADRLAATLHPDDKPLVVGMFGTSTMDGSRTYLLEQIERAFPSDDPRFTREVDVVGFSLGGVVARDAAIPRPDQKTLRINRLFTIAAPHNGSTAAEFPTLDEQILAIRPRSEYLTRLNTVPPAQPYRIIPYVRLDDAVVSPPDAAPPGVTPWWVQTRPFTRAHGDAHVDPRILADIARQLRGEPAYTTPPPAPIPR